MLKWIVNTIDRIFAVLGALIFSQAPMFMQQYKQQLAGHVAELHTQIEAMKQAATLSGKELTVFINKFLSNADIDFVRQGEIMQKMTERYNTLSETYLALETSSPFTRPFIFMSNFYNDIAKDTYKTFKFGLEFSFEGLIYALIGVLVGYCLFAGFRSGFRSVGSLFSKRASVE